MCGGGAGGVTVESLEIRVIPPQLWDCGQVFESFSGSSVLTRKVVTTVGASETGHQSHFLLEGRDSPEGRTLTGSVHKCHLGE